MAWAGQYGAGGGDAYYGFNSGAGYGGAGGGYDVNATFEHISYDTSSQDPELMAARVFVGSLNTSVVSRDKLIKCYSRFGSVIACTCFKTKGYAFVQYSTKVEAQNAVQNTCGLQLGGQRLDVKMACDNKPQGQAAGGRPAKQQASGFAGPAAKKTSQNTNWSWSAGAAQQKTQKRPMPLLEDNTAQEELFAYDTRDTLLCGNCDKVFHEWTQFRDHRKQPCDQGTGQQENPNGNASAGSGKPEDEPAVVLCFVCKVKFEHSWTLLNHLKTHHKLTMFAVEGEDSATT